MNAIRLQPQQCLVKFQGKPRLLEVTHEWKQDGDSFFARESGYKTVRAFTPNLPAAAQSTVAATFEQVLQKDRSIGWTQANSLPKGSWVVAQSAGDEGALELFRSDGGEVLTCGPGPKPFINLELDGHKASFYTPDRAHFSADKNSGRAFLTRHFPKFYRVTSQEAKSLMEAAKEGEGRLGHCYLTPVGLAGRIALQLSGAFSQLAGKGL